jgi:hypothetical protein
VTVLVSVTGAGVMVVVAVEVEAGSVIDAVSVTAGKVDVTTIVWAGAVTTEVDVAAAKVVVAVTTTADRVTSDVSVRVFAGAVLVQGAAASVTVIRLDGPSVVWVMVRSLMPMTLEQKAEALAATSRRTASSTLSLRSRLGEPGAACTLPRNTRSKEIFENRNIIESVCVIPEGRGAAFEWFISPLL